MIRSMTGYGKAETQLENKKITVEIRSLNSKQADLSVKLPSIYRQSEYEIRGAVMRRLQRGKIDLYISYEMASQTGTVTINGAAFSGYYQQLEEIADHNQMEWGSKSVDAALVSSILRLPEVVQNETAVVADAELEALKATVEQALQQIDNFRGQEGTVLMADILKRVDHIEALKDAITPYEESRTEAIRNRIREHIESLNIPFDSNRLEQEMIFYIEKLDITEEKVRLQNHCSYFREVARNEEGAGRKLGFITQEMGREINTLGSKSNQSEMQKLVVEMKDALEKIKEQLLNIL